MKTKITTIAIFYLLFLTIHLQAQQKNLATLETESKKIKKSTGAQSLEYASSLLNIAGYYYNTKNDSKMLATWKEVEGILSQQTKSLPKEYDALLLVKEKMLAIRQVLYFDQSIYYLDKKEYLSAQKILLDNKWFDSAVESDLIKVYQIIEAFAQKSGSASVFFLPIWQKAYFLISDEKAQEKCWQILLSIREKEFGKEGEPFISALYGQSNYYRRIGNMTQYSNLKKEVEKQWEFAYGNLLINTSPSNNKELKKDETEIEIEQDEENPIYTIVEQMPRFPGCDELEGTNKEKKECADRLMLNFIYQNVSYPSLARENNVEGMAVISFTVTEYGSIVDLIVIKDPGSGCGEEVIKIVSLMNELSTRWTPGEQRGKLVRVRYNLPVNFKLN